MVIEVVEEQSFSKENVGIALTLFSTKVLLVGVNIVVKGDVTERSHRIIIFLTIFSSNPPRITMCIYAVGVATVRYNCYECMRAWRYEQRAKAKHQVLRSTKNNPAWQAHLIRSLGTWKHGRAGSTKRQAR